MRAGAAAEWRSPTPSEVDMHPHHPHADALTNTARAMVTPGRGILAADESTGTIGKRFAAIGVANEEPNRREYRELLFRTPSLGSAISGVILYSETLRQKAADGTPLVELLHAAGVIPGIKVDTGTQPLPGAPGETITEGLDGLHGRLVDYRALGARFAKWRAVLHVGTGQPSDLAVRVNAHALARYAALCQEVGLVPIVEPEVLMDGAHDLEESEAASERTLRAVFAALAEQRVLLEGMVLKPNMVIAGLAAARQAEPEQVADATLRVLLRTVPAAVPGIAFLSGGMSDEASLRNLDAINRAAPGLRAPWSLTFSYGRGLQAAALHAWGGMPQHVPAAQRAFAERAAQVADASLGRLGSL